VTRYIYIIVTPTSDEIPSTFQANVVWYQGKAGTVTTYDTSGNAISTQEIVKGQPMEEPETPTVEEGETFEGWYLDEECTIPADFNSMQGVTLYPLKYEQIPSDWIMYDEEKSTYYVTCYYCETLPPDNIIIPETYQKDGYPEASITYIEMETFMDYDNIVRVKLPSTLTSIGAVAFQDCSNLVFVDFSECVNLHTIGYAAFDYANIMGVDLSNTILENVSSDLFSSSGLRYVKFPYTILTIENSAFSYCENLESITFELSAEIFDVNMYHTAICGGSFSNCPKLTSVNFTGDDISRWIITDGMLVEYRLSEITSEELVSCLTSDNDWFLGLYA
ncbi:MAG: leucine-rich repeat domain-containing protein, partial [Clostridia bacterium]|nr:leucine-rich repeat domain-containing protein [Clostridia bacterium]